MKTEHHIVNILNNILHRATQSKPTRFTTNRNYNYGTFTFTKSEKKLQKLSETKSKQNARDSRKQNYRPTLAKTETIYTSVR